MLSYKNLPYVNWVLNSLPHCKWNHILTRCRSKSKTKSMQLKVIMEMVICKLNKIYDRHLLHLTLQFPREICFYMKQQSQSQTDQFQSVLIFPSRYTFSSRFKMHKAEDRYCYSFSLYFSFAFQWYQFGSIITYKYWIFYVQILLTMMADKTISFSTHGSNAGATQQSTAILNAYLFNSSDGLSMQVCPFPPYAATSSSVPNEINELSKKAVDMTATSEPNNSAVLWKLFVLFKIYHCYQKKFTFLRDCFCFWWHQEIFINLSKLCLPLKITQEAML